MEGKLQIFSFLSCDEKYFQKTVHRKNAYALPRYGRVQYTDNTMGSIIQPQYESFGPQYEIERPFIRVLLVMVVWNVVIYFQKNML